LKLAPSIKSAILSDAGMDRIVVQSELRPLCGRQEFDGASANCHPARAR
jgi:hypothetical protein